jgi:hypothetical protein
MVRIIPYLSILALLSTIITGVMGASLLFAAPAELQTGDIIFQESRSSQSEAIQRATGSKYSHMGMIVVKDGKTLVLEAVSPVRYTVLELWINKGDNRHYVVKRYQEDGNGLDEARRRRLVKEGEKYLGVLYDRWFGWSDDRQYCSELVYKVYQRALGIELAPLSRMRSFNLSDPAIKAKMKERYGDSPPLDELVIPPSALFDSGFLVTIHTQ